MEPAKGGRPFPHVALLYVLVAVLTAAQLTGLLLLRDGLADADRVCAERAHRAERQAIGHVTDLLVKATRATHGPHAEFSGGEMLMPPPMSAPATAESPAQRRHRARRQAAEAEQGYRELGPDYSFASGELLPGARLEEGSGSGGLEDGDNGLRWIPSYSRIPAADLRKFCLATKDYCPPGRRGAQGPPGEPGLLGLKGEVGFPGVPGAVGPVGPIGLPGAKGVKGSTGSKGHRGREGLEGRDGLPGEPGMDGIPGRNGLDGFPGVDGIPGQDGTPGKNGLPGRDGKDGEKGDKGDQGPQGIKGDVGLVGPRGSKGVAGKDGQHGIPGINAVNTTEGKLFYPPRIFRPNPPGGGDKKIRVKEDDNLVLRCAATGVPPPNISWDRPDGHMIGKGTRLMSSVEDRDLDLSRIHRKQNGRYRCNASNGIKPDASKIFDVIVMYPPLIRCSKNQKVRPRGETVTFVCRVEASEELVNYWRFNGKLLDKKDQKYVFEQSEEKRYNEPREVISKLTIKEIGDHDYGKYFCISKNLVGRTEGAFTLYPPGAGISEGQQNQIVYGRLPHNMTDQNDPCPAQKALPCGECPQSPYQGVGGFTGTFGSVVRGVTIITAEDNETDVWKAYGPTNRTEACELSAVGKPVFNRLSWGKFGAWMSDAAPPTETDGNKYWYTNDTDPKKLFEYSNKDRFDHDNVSRTITLPEPHQGNSHVVFNGSFYYHKKDTKTIARFNLRSAREENTLKLPYLAKNQSVTLYNSSNTYVDFAVDENGLWVIYALPSNNLGVVKLAPNLSVMETWNISFTGDSHAKDGDMIIVCGVLYGIKSRTEINTKFSLAFDLYNKKSLEYGELTFTNPFEQTTMIGYNHHNKEIYSWDKGNQLSYPVKKIAIDDGSSTDEPKIDINSPDHDITESVEEI